MLAKRISCPASHCSTSVRPEICLRTGAGLCQAQRRVEVACSASTSDAASEHQLRRPMGAIAAALMAVAVCTTSPAAIAEEARAPKNVPETVYFGNGCFWGRQFDFVSTEKAIGRAPEQISSVVGYAGGRAVGPDGKVCYYLADPRTVYEKLGHAEVVQVSLDTQDDAKREQEFRQFANTYFKQFRRTENGMQRLDPQDAGPGYRNVIGLPGGVNSPLFQILKDENMNKMDLRAGSGNKYVDQGGFKEATEDDLLNVVWVVDSTELPFYQAERYHQFHNGIGKMFPLSYTWDMKNRMLASGKLASTGCPEFPF